MALLQTPPPAKSFRAPDFSLIGTDGKTYDFAAVSGEKGTVIMFICNHCPYVVAVIDRLVADCAALQAAGIGCAAIMANDTAAYPADSYENMKIFAAQHGLTFPYLIDETQDVARAYDAVCTPDIYGFDAQGVLVYRGRVDSAGPHPADAATKRELREAMLAVAAGQAPPDTQYPSMGCSLKWKG